MSIQFKKKSRIAQFKVKMQILIGWQNAYIEHVLLCVYKLQECHVRTCSVDLESAACTPSFLASMFTVLRALRCNDCLHWGSLHRSTAGQALNLAR